MRTVPVAVALSFTLALPIAGRQLTIGNDVSPSAPDSGFTSPRTTIDLAHPASATGTVSSVKYSWSTAGCANALKIKFFRRNGLTYTMTEERGPFTSSTSATLTLTPPVNVRQGDLIGIARLSNCGTPMASSVGSDGFLVFAGDLTASVSYSDALGRAMASLVLSGTGDAAEEVEGVIAVAGSLRGGFGSNFKTTVSLFNPSSAGFLYGRVVFRPQGTTVGEFASMPYSLAPGEMTTFPDIVEAMGQSGIGSLDLVVKGDDSAPIVTSRVYNDAGTSGTAGLSQDLIGCDETLKGMARILRRGTTGYLFTPLEPGRTRYNIGVRTLDSGAKLEVTLKSWTGVTLRTVTKTYHPNWFEQVDAASFLGRAIEGNESIEIHVTEGGAIVYGATTDNVTNDPAVQFAVVRFSEGS
jgi:hypothetical protein